LIAVISQHIESNVDFSSSDQRMGPEEHFREVRRKSNGEISSQGSFNVRVRISNNFFALRHEAVTFGRSLLLAMIYFQYNFQLLTMRNRFLENLWSYFGLVVFYAKLAAPGINSGYNEQNLANFCFNVALVKCRRSTKFQPLTR